MVDEQEWNQLEYIREEFIHELSKNMYLYGISQSVGRLYGTVLFSDKPMNLDEMSQSLGMSKTSMSTGIRALLEANMVDRVWQRGTRKDLYQAEEDWYKSFSTVFLKRWRTSVDNNLKAVKKMREALNQFDCSPNEEIKRAIESDRAKLEYAQQYYEWLQEVILLFETEKIYQIVPKK